MRFEVSTRGSLKGTVTVPGDRILTLTSLAFSALSEGTFQLTNPSPSPDVDSFTGWLTSCGCEIGQDSGVLTINTGQLPDEIGLDSAVPEDILHILAVGAVFSGRKVRISNLEGRRSVVAGMIAGLLRKAGLPNSSIERGESEMLFSPSAFPSETVQQVESSWEAECFFAAALASKQAFNLSAPLAVLSHTTSLAQVFGYSQSTKAVETTREFEIERRLAKASGKALPEVKLYEYTGAPIRDIDIPGDSTLAAALTFAASILPKSKLKIKSVAWGQARRGFFDTVKRMKGALESEPIRRKQAFESADIIVEWSPLESVHVNAEQARSQIHELLILGAVGICAAGETVISDTGDHSPGAGRDRFNALARGIETLGGHVGDYADGIVVKGGGEIRGNLIDSCGLPDLALAFYVLGLYAAGTSTVFGFEEHNYPVYEFKALLDSVSGLL